MEDQNKDQGNGKLINMPAQASGNQKAHVPCPNCSDRLYVDNPEIELFNTLHISQLIATHSTVRCRKCDSEFVPALDSERTVVNWTLLKVEKLLSEEERLIVVPSIDESKLRLT